LALGALKFIHYFARHTVDHKRSIYFIDGI